MRRFIPYFLLAVVLLTTFLIYRPGLNGPFLFDDQINIVNNQQLRIQDFSADSLKQAAFSIPNGFFRRPLSMLSFSLNFYLDRATVSPFQQAYPFKLTNLLIHLLNGIAVFILTRLLVGAYRERYQPSLSSSYPDWIALAVSAAWLLHPLNLTSVLYVVQRMTSLSALFVFLGLIFYVWGRTRIIADKRGGLMAILASIVTFTPLAVLCKENGALLPFLLLVTEITLFRFETARPAIRHALVVLFLVCTIIPILVFIAYVTAHPDLILAGYVKRDFSLSERLMTEARVIWFYLRLTILPSNALMALFHDDMTTSRALLHPFSTLPAILGIFALLPFAWIIRKRQPLLAFGILFFLVGHSMESTFLPLELIHEHRNYLPMYGILLAFFHLLIEPVHFPDTKFLRRGLTILLLSLFAFNTYSRSNSWSSDDRFLETEVAHHPKSARANASLAGLYESYAIITTDNPASKEVNYQPARNYYEQALKLDINDVNALFGLIRLSATHGKQVEKSWLDELTIRLERKALPANVNDLLISLVRCKMQEPCTLTKDEIESLLNAPLRNPKVVGREKALAYTALTYYFFNFTHDMQNAIATSQKAINLAPQELELRLSLITVLITAQHKVEAREQIQLLKQMDKQGRLAGDIAALERQL